MLRGRGQVNSDFGHRAGAGTNAVGKRECGCPASQSLQVHCADTTRSAITRGTGSRLASWLHNGFANELTWRIRNLAGFPASGQAHAKQRNSLKRISPPAPVSEGLRWETESALKS